MDIASQYADVYTDFQGLSQLHAQAGNNDRETLRKVAGQFEALFIQMMLKSMRDASLGEGLMDSEHVKTYQTMCDRQSALDLSRRSNLGLAEMMVRQLSHADNGAAGADGTATGKAAADAPTGLPLQPNHAPDKAGAGAQPAPAQPVDWQSRSPESFVRELLPHARQAASDLGTSAEVLIAQAALETGWGRHMIRNPDGSNSFNLFGIKADASWQGARALTDTVEYRDGLMRRERAPFRSYGSVAESFADYVDFLKSSPRYREALNQAGDPSAYAQALSQAGYATDPDYHGKIETIMDSNRLRDAISAAGNVAEEPLG